MIAPSMTSLLDPATWPPAVVHVDGGVRNEHREVFEKETRLAAEVNGLVDKGQQAVVVRRKDHGAAVVGDGTKEVAHFGDR